MSGLSGSGEIREEMEVPLARVANFVRQVTHDVRNTLNALDLQTAYLLELTTHPEAEQELKRMREQIQQSAKAMQSLSGQFWISQLSLIVYDAKILAEDFRDRLQAACSRDAGRVQWSLDLAQDAVEIDVELVFGALTEVFRNVFHFAQPNSLVPARFFTDAGKLAIEVQQTPAAKPDSPEAWGREPFISSRRGAYGLGLFKAKKVLAAHHGEITFCYGSGCSLLTTRVTLPLASSR